MEKSELEQLKKSWMNYKISNIQGITATMQYDYGTNEDEKESIANAICLWEFSSKLAYNDDRRSLMISLIENHEVTSHTRLVAIIEGLPDKVWRKILWEKNCDFLSFESFLRRIEADQTIAIHQNFGELFGENKSGKLPEVLTRTLGNKLHNLFTGYNVEKLLSEPYQFQKRNESKGAWAFNLLHLDFGFSLYPNGDNEDTKIADKKWTRFLSIKAHINDFVVDQEQGLYWWLYKNARSNYVIRLKKEVKLKDHICPGFWATFLIHLIFWILSPLAFSILLPTLLHLGIKSHTWLIFPTLISAITPMWLVIATIIFIVKQAQKIKVSEQLAKTLKRIGTMFLVMISFIVAMGIVWAIEKVALFLFPILGKVLSVLVILTMLFYILSFVMYVINEIKENYKHFYGDQVPKWIKRSAFAVLFAIAVKLFILYALASTISVFVALWGFITAFPLLFAFITISFSTLVVCFYLISLYKDEEAFAKADKIIQYLMLGWVTSLFLFCFGQLAVNIEIVNEFFHSPLFLLLLFICIIIFFILKWMSGKVNSETIETIRIAKIRMIRLEELAIKISTKLTFGESFLMRNTHILEDDFEKWLDQLIFLSECLFSYRNKRLRLDFLYRIIPSLDGDIITILNSNRDNIQAEDEEDRLQYIKYLLRWKDAEDAKEKLTEIKETKARSRKFWKKIAKPFVAIGKGIGWIFEEIGDFFSTSVRLWEYFNKHCPYIHKTETLQFRTPQAIDLDEW